VSCACMVALYGRATWSRYRVLAGDWWSVVQHWLASSDVDVTYTTTLDATLWVGRTPDRPALREERWARGNLVQRYGNHSVSLRRSSDVAFDQVRTGVGKRVDGLEECSGATGVAQTCLQRRTHSSLASQLFSLAACAVWVLLLRVRLPCGWLRSCCALSLHLPQEFGDMPRLVTTLADYVSKSFLHKSGANGLLPHDDVSSSGSRGDDTDGERESSVGGGSSHCNDGGVCHDDDGDDPWYLIDFESLPEGIYEDFLDPPPFFADNADQPGVCRLVSRCS
jgi:hypothetical protein